MARGESQRVMRQLPESVASNISKLRRMLHGYMDSEALDSIGVFMSTMHSHDGGQMPIAWNDVQAAIYENKYIRYSEAPLLQVPDTASEGYNQHHHTSDFDGGVIHGLGIHDHRSNLNGGFCFAVFHPGTTLPQATWET